MFYLQMGFYSQIERFTIRMDNWTLESRSYLTEGLHTGIEFSHINYDQYSGRPYKYAYMVERWIMSNSSIMKVCFF